MVIMGIVAAVAVARFGDMATRARIAATRESVRAIQATVDEEQAVTGAWPTLLTSVMFSGDQWPRNAFLPNQRQHVDVESSSEEHPGPMATKDLNDGAFWYNNRLGIIRARVTPMDTSPETLALYNLVNGTVASVLIGGQVGGALGGATGGATGKTGGQVELVPE